MKRILFTMLLIAGTMMMVGCSSSSSGDGTKSVQDTAIEKIVVYAQSGSPTPAIQDYIDAGITGVNDDNLAQINEIVAGHKAEDVDTAEEIQALADQLNLETTENLPPVALAGSPKTTVEYGGTVKFSSRHSYDPDGEIVQYVWYENGQVVARVPYFFKAYYKAGTYSIKLVVTDNDGATSSTEYTITVKPKPEPVAKKSASTTTSVGSKTFENNTDAPIPDLSTITVDVDAADAVSSISKVTVTINLDHTYVGDLIISLISPNGTTIRLTNRNGSWGENFTNTVFDDDASVSITSISGSDAPFTGTYRPVDPLSTFNTEDPNGTWTLKISDNAGADSGTFHSVSITIE